VEFDIIEISIEEKLVKWIWIAYPIIHATLRVKFEEENIFA